MISLASLQPLALTVFMNAIIRGRAAQVLQYEPYTSENKTLCLPCNESCSRCLSLNQCTKCSKGFYLEGETCDSKCIDGKYANNANGSCTFCDSVCETCYGLGTNDCIKCNSQKGYTFGANKICGFLNCEDGIYYDKGRSEERR